MFPSEEAHFLMRKYYISSWRITFPHEEVSFFMRKYASSWGSMFPLEEADFLRRQKVSSWGSMFPPEEVCFLLRKHVSRWGEECFLMRYLKKIGALRKFIIPQYFFRASRETFIYIVCSTIPIASSLSYGYLILDTWYLIANFSIDNASSCSVNSSP